MTDKSFWIEATDDIESHPALDEVHDELRGPGGRIYNLYRAFSSRPAPLAPAVRHYRAVLQGDENTLGSWRLEMIATYVTAPASRGDRERPDGPHPTTSPHRSGRWHRRLRRMDFLAGLRNPAMHGDDSPLFGMKGSA